MRQLVHLTALCCAILAAVTTAAAQQSAARVRFDTSLGSFTIEVDGGAAPATAANFLKYVDGGFYDNGRFHRATRADNYVVNLNDQPSLDFGGKRFDDGQGAAAFGRVVAGMDVVRKIQQQPTKSQSLEPPITILSAKRVTP